MDRAVTYKYENGGWGQTVRSNERKTLPPKTGDPENILVRKGWTRPR